jgi:hypothetical protein
VTAALGMTTGNPRRQRLVGDGRVASGAPRFPGIVTSCVAT